MSAVPTNKKRARQSANEASARHSGEGRNSLSSSFRTPRSGDPESSFSVSPETVALAPLGDLCEARVLQDGPKGRSEFVYVDIGSIDRESKLIVEPKTLAASQAPSRAKQILKAGDVVVSMTRPNLNAVAMVPPELDGAIGSTGFHVLRTKDAEPGFLFYAVQTPAFVEAMTQKVQGALYPAVRPKDISEFCIPRPSRTEQKRIVAEIEKQFTRLDTGVAALRRVQANLKRYRAAVLKAACEGRLVPTEAELAKTEGRTYETGEQLLARILADRRKNWPGRGKYKEPAAPDTTNLQLLPEGWTWATVAQLSMLVQYGSSAKTNEDSTGIPVLRMGNIQEGKFDLAKLKYLPSEHNEFPELLLARGDLLFNRTNSAELVGKTAVFKGSLEPCSFASYLIRVRFGDGYTSELASYFINSVYGRSWVNGVVSQQVGQANVNGTKLQALAVPLPPLAEQNRIVAEVERRLSIVEELEAAVAANLQRATRLRQSTLQCAFTCQ